MSEKINPYLESSLLTPEERDACQLASSGEAPYSQRANALLALDQGATQAQAAENAGLTLGQVRYWLGRFREDRLAIFPDPVKSDPGAGSPAAPDPTTPTDGLEPVKTPKKAKNSNKSRKSKGKKSKAKSRKKDRPKTKAKGKKKVKGKEKSK
jgi:hypothetical protein